jgi:nicotinamidase-related amidase
MPDSDTALLAMDVQEEIVDRFGDHTEVSSRNASFARLAESGGFVGEASRVHPAVAPQASDPEVIKKRVSAFAGSDLELLLRAREIQTLMLTGIATSGVVLSTLRAAADLDFRLIVLADCCLDGDPEVHRVLLEKVFPQQAEVIDVEGWERRLKS